MVKMNSKSVGKSPAVILSTLLVMFASPLALAKPSDTGIGFESPSRYGSFTEREAARENKAQERKDRRDLKREERAKKKIEKKAKKAGGVNSNEGGNVTSNAGNGNKRIKPYPRRALARGVFELDGEFQGLVNGILSYSYDNCSLPSVLSDITPKHAFMPAYRNGASWTFGVNNVSGTEQGYLCFSSVKTQISLEYVKGVQAAHSGVMLSSTCPSTSNEDTVSTVALTWWLPVQAYPEACHLGAQ